jgi:cytochrome c oxidase subunit III
LSESRFLGIQFDDLRQQKSAATLGMWVFLATEVMFFGGLFLGYSVYRVYYPAAFAEGSRHTDLLLGSLNTFVLLCSSFTMAMAVHSAERGRRKAVVLLLLATIVLGLGFLALKFLEYAEHIGEGLSPGPSFHFPGELAPQVHLFFSFYFVMTGAHALHMVVGVAILSTMVVLTLLGRVTEEHYTPVEVTGLYWHFVDIVWIFLFPLFYLIDLHR